METTNRLITLAMNDANIDQVIRLLAISQTKQMDNIVQQLKAEQKRLYYPEQIKTP